MFEQRVLCDNCGWINSHSDTIKSAEYAEKVFNCKKCGAPQTYGKAIKDFDDFWEDYQLSDRDSDFLINNGVLFEYSGINENVVLPSDVTELGDFPFSNEESIVSISFPEGLLKIGDRTFGYSLKRLTSVNIPASVTEISSGAFDSCEFLIEINVSNLSRSFSSIDGVLFNKSQTEVCCYPRGKSGSFIVPNSVTKFCEKCFSGAQWLSNIKLPDRLSIVGKHAFLDCYSISEINLPNSLFEIHKSAFMRCTNLSAVNLPSSLKVLQSGAFVGCTSIHSIQIPNGITVLEDYVFKFCKNLVDVILPDSLTKISVGAFQGCESLTSIHLPETVSEIWGAAFEGCTSLRSMNIPYKLSHNLCGFRGTPFRNTTDELFNVFRSNSQVAYLFNIYALFYNDYLDKLDSLDFGDPDYAKKTLDGFFQQFQ